MSSSFKNVLVILVLVTLGFVAYYVIFSKDDGVMAIGENSMIPPELYTSTQLFIEHRKALDNVKIDVSIFENQYFTSYKDFTIPVQSQPTKRENPFDKTIITSSDRGLGS